MAALQREAKSALDYFTGWHSFCGRIPLQQYCTAMTCDRIEKILSGGQTEVDPAALDWAIDNGIGHGGWCAKGRHAEDGIIPNLTCQALVCSCANRKKI